MKLTIYMCYVCLLQTLSSLFEQIVQVLGIVKTKHVIYAFAFQDV